jgi:hypothetical protein
MDDTGTGDDRRQESAYLVAGWRSLEGSRPTPGELLEEREYHALGGLPPLVPVDTGDTDVHSAQAPPSGGGTGLPRPPIDPPSTPYGSVLSAASFGQRASARTGREEYTHLPYVDDCVLYKVQREDTD